MLTGKCWKDFPTLFAAVKETHLEYGVTGGCHDFTHAIAVAQMVYEILPDHSDDEFVGTAVIAGMCHNADRLIQHKRGLGKFDESEPLIRAMVSDWLKISITGNHEPVIDAVLRHSRPNADDDSWAAIALKDADRLVNTQLSVVMRAGEHFGELPAFDPSLKDAGATFRDPKTVLQSLRYNLEWLSDDPKLAHVRVRLPKAIAMARSHKVMLDHYLRCVELQTRELFGDEAPDMISS